MHFQFLDAHSRQTVGFFLVFVSLFYIFLTKCFLKLFILLVCLWGITLCQFWHYSGKWKTCLMRHSYLYLVEYEHFFRTSCVNFVYSFLITFQFSFWISFSDYPYWFVLLYPVFFNYSLLLQHFSHVCSTVPSLAPLFHLPPFLCEKMQLEYLPVNCNHFCGSDGSRDYMYCAWTRGRGKSLKKISILSTFFNEDRSHCELVH